VDAGFISKGSGDSATQQFPTRGGIIKRIWDSSSVKGLRTISLEVDERVTQILTVLQYSSICLKQKVLTEAYKLHPLADEGPQGPQGSQ